MQNSRCQLALAQPIRVIHPQLTRMETYYALKQLFGDKVTVTLRGEPKYSPFRVHAHPNELRVGEFEPRISCWIGWGNSPTPKDRPYYDFEYSPSAMYKSVVYITEDDPPVMVFGHNKEPFHPTFKYIMDRETGNFKRSGM